MSSQNQDESSKIPEESSVCDYGVLGNCLEPANLSGAEWPEGSEAVDYWIFADFELEKRYFSLRFQIDDQRSPWSGPVVEITFDTPFQLTDFRDAFVSFNSMMNPEFDNERMNDWGSKEWFEELIQDFAANYICRNGKVAITKRNGKIFARLTCGKYSDEGEIDQKDFNMLLDPALYPKRIE